ncbi:glycine oxidase ThiO [Halobacillus seohaensis]|uniref:glycine oxidase n=1 Tax=Halobacillus seohaensis TaxID=447421 RepID=A0ABW2EIW8_9BACI
MKQNFDVLIVGGGIIGHSISYYLNKAGVHSVVIEKQESGNRATKAAAGMLGVHTENKTNNSYYQFCSDSRNQYQELSKELWDLTGINIGLSNFGMMQVAQTEQEKNALLSKREPFSNLEWINQAQLRARNEHLSNHIKGALLMKDDGHVEPANVCEAFKRGALLHGGKVTENTNVIGIEKERSSQDFLVHLETETIPVEKVVLASGAESGSWFENTGLTNPIVPTKGECFSIRPRITSLTETIFNESCYIVPKSDGRYIIGATSLPYDHSTHTSAGGLEDLMNKAFSLVPSLRDEPFLDYWSGIRPGTLDHMPIIGEHPSLQGLYFATGHYRNGILLAPATGEMITNLIVKSPVAQGLEETFSPNRFQTQGGSLHEYTS